MLLVEALPTNAFFFSCVSEDQTKTLASEQQGTGCS
jgi:hypothetical protein